MQMGGTFSQMRGEHSSILTYLLTQQRNGNGQASTHAAGVSPGPDAGSGRELHLREKKVALLSHRRARNALQDHTILWRSRQGVPVVSACNSFCSIAEQCQQASPAHVTDLNMRRSL